MLLCPLAAMCLNGSAFAFGAQSATVAEGGAAPAETSVSLAATGLREALVAFTEQVNQQQKDSAVINLDFEVTQTNAVKSIKALYGCPHDGYNANGDADHPNSLFENGAAALVEFAHNDDAGDASGAVCILKYQDAGHTKMNGICEHWDGLGVDSDFILSQIDIDLAGGQETPEGESILVTGTLANISDVTNNPGYYPLWAIGYYGSDAIGKPYNPTCAGQNALP